MPSLLLAKSEAPLPVAIPNKNPRLIGSTQLQMDPTGQDWQGKHDLDLRLSHCKSRVAVVE